MVEKHDIKSRTITLSATSIDIVGALVA